MGQEKRVKSEGKKNDFGFVFEFWVCTACSSCLRFECECFDPFGVLFFIFFVLE